MGTVKQYYHLSKNKNLKVGDIFDNTRWGNSWYFNQQFGCATNPILVQQVDRFLDSILPKHLRPEIIEPLISSYRQIFVDSKPKAALLKEFIFEKVRVSVDPGLPSRMSCAFLSSVDFSPEVILKRYGYDLFSHSNAFYRLSDADSSNKNFLADPSFLDCDSQTPLEIEKRALAYWSGQKKTPDGIQEILAIGKYLILEKLNGQNGSEQPV